MKIWLLAGIYLSLTLPAWGECAPGGLTVFPSGATLNRNPVLLIEGYGAGQPLIHKLGKQTGVYLIGNAKRIKLLVKEVRVGQFWLTQAILVPQTLLDAGVAYHLQIGETPYYHSISRWNPVTKQDEVPVYVTNTKIDAQPPAISRQPKEIGKTYIGYGCGPEVTVNFDCPVSSDESVLVKTTVKHKKTGTSATYYVQPTDRQIRIGHGMCSGAFRLIPADEYEVTFSLMDVSGNITLSNGLPILFRAPVDPMNG